MSHLIGAKDCEQQDGDPRLVVGGTSSGRGLTMADEQLGLRRERSDAGEKWARGPRDPALDVSPSPP
jgi:hypothetical protein